MPYYPNIDVLYIAVPKAGSSSLAGVLKLMNGHKETPLLIGSDKHLNLETIMHQCPEYTKGLIVSMVRDPWERTVSNYNYSHIKNKPTPEELKKKKPKRSFHDMSFEEFIERKYEFFKKGKLKTQKSFLTINGEIPENLIIKKLSEAQELIDMMSQTLNQEERVFPHLNKKTLDNHKDYYIGKTKDIVAEINQTDIQEFGFEF